MRRRLWFWLRPLIGVVIVAALVWQLGTDAFLAGIRLVDGAAVLAALGIGALTTVLCACRWCLIARRLGLRLPLSLAIGDYYRAQFLNAVLPVGVLGDADRAVRHGRETGELGRGVRAVILERVGGQLVLVAAGVAVLLAGPSWGSAVSGQLVPTPAVAVTVLAGLVVVAALAGWAWWGRASSRRRAALAATLADVRQGLFARDTWPGVVLLSAAALAGYLTLFVVAARTAGSSAPVAQLLPLLLLALLVMALPFNVGGWGPREAFAALAFGAAGLGSAQGLTVAVTYGVLALIASLPGGVMVILRRTRLPRPSAGEPASHKVWEPEAYVTARSSGP